MTAYASTRVAVGPGLAFTIEGNSKITLGNGSYAEPAPNALSLPHGSTCPGATPTCLASCYVEGLRQRQPEIYDAYRANERVLHQVLMTPGGRAIAARKLGAWIEAQASEGFRWHVSGDVIHDRHAEWIVNVCRASSNVRHWIYTKTFAVVAILKRAPNLVVNVSADWDNYCEARRVAERNGVRLCFEAIDNGVLPDDLRPGDVVFPDYSLRGRELDDPTEAPWWQGLDQDQRRLVCPADFFGQSEQHRCGPCAKCLVKP